MSMLFVVIVVYLGRYSLILAVCTFTVDVRAARSVEASRLVRCVIGPARTTLARATVKAKLTFIFERRGIL